MRGDAGVGAPVVVILRELRRDDIAEHVRRARSEHLREGRDRPRHLRAERREGRHGDQGIFHPQSALLGNPGFVNGARIRVGPRSGPVRRGVGGFTRANRSARVARYPSKRPTVPEAWITARGRLPAPFSVTFSFNKLPNLFWLAASVDSAGPIHLARRVDPDTTPRTSIADVVPDRARALGVDQAGIHRPPGRRPRAWWTCRHRVSARNA